MKHTKIVATLGPASEGKDIQREMIDAGANVFRLNLSHGEHAWHRAMIGQVRELSEELNTPIAILADLQGPRIRAEVRFPIEVKRGYIVRLSDLSHRAAFSPEEPVVFLDTPGILESLEGGERVLIDDGLISLVVTNVGKGVVEARAEEQGVIQTRKGVILPDTDIDLPALSDKDKADLQFLLDEGVDYVGLSFVGSAQDIESVRHMIGQYLGGKGEAPKLVAKIERKEAVKNLSSVVTAADAVMVARGDLGIEMPESEVAILQKEIVEESLRQMRPVIVATQMLASMAHNPRPTRAEVSDVSNAVIDHADAVMLSEESASGRYPVEAIRTMREIIEKTEESRFDDLYQALDLNLKSEYAVLIRSVYELAKSYRAKAIVLLSISGFTARLISHFRPDARLLVATTKLSTWRSLALLWGVEPVLFAHDRHLDTVHERLLAQLKEEGKVVRGDQVVIFSGRTPDRETMKLVGVREVR